MSYRVGRAVDVTGGGGDAELVTFGSLGVGFGLGFSQPATMPAAMTSASAPATPYVAVLFT